MSSFCRPLLRCNFWLPSFLFFSLSARASVSINQVFNFFIQAPKISLGYVIRDLEATTQAEFSEETKAWKNHDEITGTAYDTDCGSIYLFGGVGFAVADGPFQRTYENLPAHQFIAVSLETYLIDATVGENGPTYEIGDASGGFTINDPSSLTTNYCGSGAVPDLGPIPFFQTIQHSDSTLNFGLQIDDGQGIRNIKILLVTSDLSSNTANWPIGCAITDPVSLVDYFPCGCSQGQYFDGSSCQDCDDACGNCYDAGSNSCYSCKDGYDFDGAICYVCDEACDTCYGPDADMCYTCNDGYYFDGTSSCLECNNACETCSGAGSSACLICPWGDPADANSQCILVCESACATCYGPYTNMCYTCNDGYYFDGTSSCLQCDSSCETCSGAGASACLTCPWGDPADANSQCILVCDSACNTCYDTDPNSCYTCKDGYYFDGTSSCLSCDSTCETCSGAGPTACLACPSGDPVDANSQCIAPPSASPEPSPVKSSTKTITDVKATT